MFVITGSVLSNKLYDVLMKESTANLPFNCDGCLRLLPKLNSLGSIINEQKKQFSAYEEKKSNL